MSVPKPARRRRRLIDEGEEVGVENPVVVARSSECESEDEGPPIENSESESAVDDSADQEDETEEGSETETEEGSETEETGSETEGYTDEEGLDEERQSGDGEEQPDKDKPDDDEDKRNPAYVPRKGAFYEHDLRRGAEVPEAEVTEELKPKKKLWQDEGKWVHDRYIDEMQAPKTRQELIEIYGYDIRIADRPPEAPPRRLQRDKGPKQHNFKDFIPRMAVIDTTEGGHDSVPNLGDDDFIQYRYPGSRNTHRNKGPGTDSRRGGRGGGSRRNYQSDDIEAKNNRNRLVSTRGGHGGRMNVGVPENAKSVEYPSLVDSTRQGVYRENQSWRKEDSNDSIRDNSKSDSEGTPKLYHSETDGVGYRNGNQDRFQQSQDIRRLDDSRVKNHSQYGFREEKRDNFSHGRRRESNFSNQAQQESWRSAQTDSRNGQSRTNDFVRGSRGGYNDFGNSRRKAQQPITGGNAVGSSGDSGYYGNNKPGAKGFEQTPYQQQQAEVPGTASKEAKDYTNSSYKNPEVKSKPKNAPIFPAVSIAGGGAGDNSPQPANSNSVVISNKENVQTINVTITSTTTEKKSYAKERRAKGISRAVDGAVLMGGGADPQAVPVTPVASGPYQNLSAAGVHHLDLTSAPLAAGANHYSSMRQGMFAEPPPVSGAKLYNPAMPPPPFYPREHSGLPPSQHPTHTPAGAVQDPTHFTPALLPPATALPYGLPAPNAGLALPPNVAGIPSNPALFQASPMPPAASPITAAPAVIAAPFLPTGMIYAGGARVPPPGAPTGFPLTLAYTTPPPQGAVPAAVVGSQPPPQAAAAGQHKKVYRGDITYYAPELQQPARATQKRPKAAIPIINPQEVPGQRMKVKSEEMYLHEMSTAFENKNASNSSVSVENSHVDTSIGSTRATKAAIEGHDTKTLFSSEKQLAQSNIALSQEVSVPKAVPLATHQGAPVASSQSKTNIATPQAKFVPPVNHTDNTKASSSHDGSESKKLAIKTELSPGGPPVSSSTSSTASVGKNSDQSLCTAMQNFKMEDSSGRAEISTSASGNSVMKQECEKSMTSSNESSIA